MQQGRQGGRQGEGDRQKDDEGRGLQGIRVARVKLETYPFSMSYLGFLTVKKRGWAQQFKDLTQFRDETMDNASATKK